MQIVELQLSHYNFYCPATGIQLFSQQGSQLSPALRAVWVAEIAHQPDFFHAELEAPWNAWVSTHADEEDFSWDPAAFLGTVDEPNWVAFTIHTGGGMIAETATVVIDMDTDMDAT